MKPINTLFLNALFLASVIPFPTPTDATPKLEDGTSFRPFHLNSLSYDIVDGIRYGIHDVVNFGQTNLRETFEVAGDLATIPDIKYSVLILMSDPGLQASGTFTVVGEKWDPGNPDANLSPYRTDTVPLTVDLADGVDFDLLEKFGYDRAFILPMAVDKVVELSTLGLGADVDIVVQLWIGHDQEVSASTQILGLDNAQCASGAYRVSMNGQAAHPMVYDEEKQQCWASIYPSGLHDGLYFPYYLVEDENGGITHPDGDGYFGYPSYPTFADWTSLYPYASQYFTDDTKEDTLIRPIVYDLIDDATGYIVDRRRDLYYTEVDPWGNETIRLLDDRGAEEPGVFTQLSPRGLDKLRKTHEVVLPYPTHPLGIQPRLSQVALNNAPHFHQPVDKVAFTLSVQDHYWIDEAYRVPGAYAWAGSEAYKRIFNDAVGKFERYVEDMANCASQLFPVNALCSSAATTRHCVKTPPIPAHFEVEVAALETYMHPGHPDDALSVGSVKVADLNFGDDQILATPELKDIHGWLRGSIDPDEVTVRYTPGTPLCTVKPDERNVGAFVGGAEIDPWFICDELQYLADEAVPDNPIVFDVIANGEGILTPFADAGVFGVSESTADLSLGGTCAEPWMDTFVEESIETWDPNIEAALFADWVLNRPSEDETLRRLLSPFWLGVEDVTAVPDDTPSYLVHPNDLYELTAEIAPTATDPHGLVTTADDGMYVPYVTTITPEEPHAFYRWICVLYPFNACDGVLNPHESLWPGGFDHDGETFDVAINVTPAQLNRVAHELARRSDFFGAPGDPAIIPLDPQALRDLAASKGYDEVVGALDEAGEKFSLRVFERATPYTFIPDNGGLFLVVPELVIQILSGIDEDAEIIATVVGDVVDKELQLTLAEMGSGTVDVNFSAGFDARFITTDFLEGCYAHEDTHATCADNLETVVLAYAVPYLSDTIERMFASIPAPTYFDAGQESPAPRQLKNARTAVYNSSVTMFADLCNPARANCRP